MVKIKSTAGNFEREPLASPFGFKGRHIKELWQTAALLQCESGKSGIGLGVQSILWSDAQVFSRYGELAGNNIMYLMTEYALDQARGMEFETPVDFFDQLYKPVFEYGKRLTGNENLRPTFALNSLVAVDNAAWMLYSREKDICAFDEMIPYEYSKAISNKNINLASIPLVSYNLDRVKISNLIDEGYFFFKIKIGSDPEKDGNLDKMLDWDKERITLIHNLLKDIETPYTKNRHIPYYLDANGRYDNKDRLLKLLEHADSIGALDRITLLEEPFPEDYLADVSDIPVRLAADESAHSDRDVLDRIALGYRAVALKPIAKTLSMSLKIAKAAFDKGIPCFCADLTVNPIMVDWNKNVAARLSPLPGMNIGVLESNGPQNYRNWNEMINYHPDAGAGWINTKKGLFCLDSEFYRKSGGIFQNSRHYSSLLIQK